MKGSTFQMVVSAIFVFFIIAGVGSFAIFTSGGGSSIGAVTIWGTAEQSLMENWLALLRQSDKTLADVEYTQVAASSYEGALVNAMAGGRGPDLFLLDDSQMVRFADKILAIPYDTYSQGTFTSSFVDEGRLFLAGDGIRALPVFVDPLVVYWNRDIFATAGISAPPQYWNELLTMAQNITMLDAGKNVRRSAIAMGTWRNVSYAKPLLATLFLQSGDPIVAPGADGRLQAVLGTAGTTGAESPAVSALRFYTEFANPAKNTYTWNASMPNSTNAFLSGDVALYIGFASDYAQLRGRNPNLRFDVAQMLQLRQGTPATYGRITGMAVSLGARNKEGAIAAAQRLSSKEALSVLAGLTLLPPARRDVVADTSANPAAQVFGRSSLIARGWPDPGTATDVIFKDMIESVLSGKSDPSAAIFEGSAALRELIGN